MSLIASSSVNVVECFNVYYDSRGAGQRSGESIILGIELALDLF